MERRKAPTCAVVFGAAAAERWAREQKSSWWQRLEGDASLLEAAADNIARSSSRDAIELSGVANITSEVLSNCYYASLTFIRVLEGVAQRMHYEQKMSNK